MAFKVTKEFRAGSMRVIPKTAAPAATYLSLATDGTANAYGEAAYVSAYGGLTDFTVEFWFNLTSWVGTWDRILDHNQQNGFSITRNQGANSIQFRVMDNEVNSTTLSLTNTWTHIACVRAGGARLIYINGVLNSTSTGNASALTNTQPIGIGQNRTNGSDRVNGKFADVRIWNVARSGTQIANNYNRHMVGNEAGLIANWKFIQGNTLVDSSPTNNPITIGPSTTFVSDIPVFSNANPTSSPTPDPSVPTTNLVGWYDASNSETVTVDGSNKVISWADLSGNKNTIYANSDGLRPTYVSSGLNAKNTVSFLGGQCLRIASLTLDRFTIFCIMKASSNGLVFEHGTNAGSNPGCYLYTTTNASYVVNRNGSTYGGDVSSDWLLGNTWRNLRMVNSATAVGVYTDNTLRGSASPAPSSSVTATFFLGGRNDNGVFITGQYAEVLIYNGTLTNSEITAVNSYISNKWGI